MPNATTALFVYGTLKTGEVRSKLWPFEPISVEPATLRAAIFDLGAYPAIYSGDDLVGGEIWRFHEWQMPETLAVLDRVEGFNQQGPNLYIRQEAACTLQDGTNITAFTYYYASDPEKHGSRITPDEDGVCVWSGRS